MAGVSRYNLILSLMKRVEDNHHYVSLPELTEMAKKEGINPELVRSYLEKLRRIGSIYSPRPGFFKIAE